jgi:hypothetical protein
MSTLIRSETSVTVLPNESGFPFSAGNALEDQCQDQPAGKRCTDSELGPLANGGGRRCLH